MNYTDKARMENYRKFIVASVKERPAQTTPARYYFWIILFGAFACAVLHLFKAL